MEDDPRRERQGEDDPLDLFDSEGEYSEGESVFEEHDFEPLTVPGLVEEHPYTNFVLALRLDAD